MKTWRVIHSFVGLALVVTQAALGDDPTARGPEEPWVKGACEANQNVTVTIQSPRQYLTQCQDAAPSPPNNQPTVDKPIMLQSNNKPVLSNNYQGLDDALFVGSGKPSARFVTPQNPSIATNDFSQWSGIQKLAFASLQFTTTNMTMIVPEGVTHIEFDHCNLVDFKVVSSIGSGSQPESLKTITINQPERPLNVMPKALLDMAQRVDKNPSLNGTFIIDVSFASKVFVPNEMSLNLVKRQWPSFNLTTTNGNNVDFVSCRSAAALQAGAKRDLEGRTQSALCVAETDTTPGPNVAATPPPTATTSRSGSSGSSATVIVIIALVCVGVGLAVFISKRFLFKKSAFRRRRGRRHRHRGAGDNANVGLLDKDELPSCKLSFLSNDDNLNTFRLATASVTLGKPMGHRGYFMGEYDNQKVVLKRLEHESSDEYTRKQMETQLREIMPLEHANLIKVHGVTLVAGVDFTVVLEYAEKGNLKSMLLDKDQDFDVPTRVNMCLDVASSVAFLHERNLHLRCFNTQKVLVNESLICKTHVLSAFPNGQAGESEAATADRSYGMGTVPYVAPEVLINWPGTTLVDLRKVDVYTLGVIMSEIITRHEPFQSMVNEKGHTMTDLLLVESFKRQEPLLAHEQDAEFVKMPQLFQSIVNSCLSMDPKDRPNADEVVRCLKTIKKEVGSSDPL